MEYFHNLEYGSLELHSTKAEWQAIPSDARSELKRYYRWSRHQEIWISKAKSDTRGGKLAYAESLAKQAGFEFAGEVGERLSLEEEIERKKERSERRAERLHTKAERTKDKGNQMMKNASDMLNVIPFGQPILVGHHSEHRDRRYRERALNKGIKGWQTYAEGGQIDGKADAASRNAARIERQLTSPAFLTRRIEEREAKIRSWKRDIAQLEANVVLSLAGVLDQHYGYGEKRDAETAGQTTIFDFNEKEVFAGTVEEAFAWLATPSEEGGPYKRWATPEERSATITRYGERIAQLEEELTFYQGKLEEAGGAKYSKESLKEARATHVKYRGQWYPVKRFNPKTVTVTGWLGVESMTWKAPYAEIQSFKAVPDYVPKKEGDVRAALAESGATHVKTATSWWYKIIRLNERTVVVLHSHGQLKEERHIGYARVHETKLDDSEWNPDLASKGVPYLERRIQALEGARDRIASRMPELLALKACADRDDEIWRRIRAGKRAETRIGWCRVRIQLLQSGGQHDMFSAPPPPSV